MKFEFTLAEINAIMGALGNAPYAQVHEIVAKIRAQAEPQLAEAQAAAAEQPPEA
jgi:hypothetical protein